MTSEDFLSISNELEKFHAIFYQMWKMGKPIYVTNTPTAFVQFDQKGDFISFCMNKDFWEKLTFDEKLFVICHESLHIILNHGVRLNGIKNKELGNQAADIVINHLLVKKFGFKREKIREWKEYCWIETLFDKKDDVKRDANFEYYYNLLNKKQDDVNKTPKKSLVDDHQRLGSEQSEQDSGNIIDKLNEELSNEEKKTIKDMIEKHFKNKEKFGGKLAGNKAGGIWLFAEVGKVQHKRKWETVIKKWANKYIKPDVTAIEQWARVNRRFSFLDKDLLLPSEMEDDGLTMDEKKIEVWFFQDTSGSCAGFKDRFFKAAMSLPPDRFDIKMHCFDTQVYETTIQSKKLYGFGGTSFSCIESYIQQDIRKRKAEYPKAVFVITDGCSSDNVMPQIPEKWYWFLSDNDRYYIPPKSSVYMLKDFE